MSDEFNPRIICVNDKGEEKEKDDKRIIDNEQFIKQDDGLLLTKYKGA